MFYPVLIILCRTVSLSLELFLLILRQIWERNITGLSISNVDIRVLLIISILKLFLISFHDL